MVPKNINIFMGLIGFLGVSTFVLGLAYSISTGFAKFWGGLPVWIIGLAVLSLAAFDFWNECIRKKT